MNKLEFLQQLRKGLEGLPQSEIEEQLDFYNEMIDNRMEKGMIQEEAVAAMGPLDDIIEQTIADIPLAKLAGKKLRSNKRLSSWEIALLVIGSPIWLSLLIAALAVELSLYISAWAIIISVWAVFVSFAACAPAGIAAGIGFIIGGNWLSGLAVISAGIVCAALAIFSFFLCNAATKGISWLTRKSMFRTKRLFIKKEGLN